MRPVEIRELVRLRRPPAPYGVRRLARVHSINDLATLARRRLPEGALAYLEGGSEDEHTLEHNRTAFADIELMPHILRDVTTLDTTTTVLGTTTPVPIALAPVGGPRLFHHEGELAVARAAAHAGLPYAISTLATVPLEHIAREALGPLWFQLYLWGDRGQAKDLIDRAKAAGYRALLVTVDCTVRSRRERELRAGVTLPSPHLTLRTLLEAGLHPSWWWHFLTTDPIDFPNLGSDQRDIAGLFDGSATWDDLDWITHTWDGPVALKGILSLDDARRAADLGVDAIVVSNHGGRQLDRLPATIDVLPAIADAVGDRLEVLLDSGIRRGTDIIAALAFGARAVLVGRAYLYGLATAGQPGVAHAIDILTNELRTAMALTGAARLADIDASIVRDRSRRADSHSLSVAEAKRRSD